MKQLTVSDIHKSFGNLEVLKGITLTINPDEITAIVGASGAGKTTLLQVIGTLMRPDSGRVLYDDVDVTQLGDRRLSDFRCRHIGFVFQFHQLLAEFTALENVMLPALIAGMGRRDAEKRAMELLRSLDVADRGGHRPTALSGGERQRVAVARALVNDPDIVLADEPTGSLDTRNRDEIIRIFRTLQERLGRGFVVVTHDRDFASIASRVITLSDGAVVNAIDEEV